MAEKKELIVVGVDLTPCSERALIQARRMAELKRSRLLVLYVIEPLVIKDLAAALPVPWEKLCERALKNARKAVLDFVDKAGPGESQKDVHIEVEIGSPIDSILTKTEKISAKSLVLGKFGNWGPQRGPGTVAAACVRKSPIPVLLVDGDHDPPFTNVLVGVDFSDHSRKAIEWAVEIAVQDGSRLQLLHVYAPPWDQLHYRAPTLESSPDFQEQYKMSLEGLLHESFEPFKDRAENIEVTYRLLAHPGYGHGIVEYSKKDNVDLVVLGTRGQTNLRYLFLGRTAERVLKDVDCSVLTIPTP